MNKIILNMQRETVIVRHDSVIKQAWEVNHIQHIQFEGLLTKPS